MSRKITGMLLAAALVATPIATIETKPASAKTFNIKKYGAKGHGKDDTQAIQKAVDAASHGGTVVVPKGTWRSQVIYLKGNTTIRLAKGAVMKKLAFKKHPEDAFVVFHPKKKGYNGFSKIVITGGTWDGGVHKNNKTSQHKGIEIDHGRNLTIKNTTIKNMSGLHMIEANACKNVTIDHVNFKNQYFYSGKNHAKVSNYDANTCEAVQFDSATKGAASAYPLDHTVCQNFKITNNTFNNVQSGIGTHHNEKKYWSYMHKNITIANNTFKNVKGDALHVNNVKDATVTNNKCTSGGHKFMTIYHSQDVKASYNTMSGFISGAELNQGSSATFDHESYTRPKNASSPGYTVFLEKDSGCRATFTNSTIDTEKKGAIVANEGSSLSLQNCSIQSTNYVAEYSVMGNGPKIYSIDHCTFTGNGSHWGALVKNCANVTITNNTMSGYKTDFMTMSCPNPNIVNNTVADKTMNL